MIEARQVMWGGAVPCQLNRDLQGADYRLRRDRMERVVFLNRDRQGARSGLHHRLNR